MLRSRAFACATLIALGSCGKLAINRSTAVPGIQSIPALSATLSDASAVEFSTSTVVLKASGTATAASCTYDNTAVDAATVGTTQQVAYKLNDTQYRHATFFTPTTYLFVREALIRIQKFNGPLGTLYAQLTSSLGSDPSTSLANSATITAASTTSAVGGAVETFSFSDGVVLLPNTKYALVLTPGSDYTEDGTNRVGWVTTTSGTGCSSYTVFRRRDTNAGAWYDDGSTRRSYFSIVADVHATPGNASWVLAAFANAKWDTSTFTMVENPNNTAGSVLYDIGAGDSASTPSYSSTSKTQAEVKALGTLTGQFLYLRANLSVAAPYFESAEVGSGSINAN